MPVCLALCRLGGFHCLKSVYTLSIILYKVITKFGSMPCCVWCGVFFILCFSKNSTKFTYTANQSKGALSHDWQGLGGFWVLDLVKVSKGKSP